MRVTASSPPIPTATPSPVLRSSRVRSTSRTSSRVSSWHVDDLPSASQVLAFIAQDALPVVFQPVMDIRTGKTVGAEALARFPSDPYHSPDRWFAAAIHHGVGVELELVALRSALRELPSVGAGHYVALNVAPDTLVSAQLRELLGGHDGRRIVLELTEHERVDDYGELKEAVAYYRARGIRLAVDDAGAGYASFQHILQLRPDIIKLDRGLTEGIDKNPVRYALASSLVTFAASLGARICAEGIETAEELVALQQLGVGSGQGYLLARPGPLPLPSAPPGLWFLPDRAGLDEDALTGIAAPGPIVPPALRSPTRLAALQESALLESGRDEALDRLTRLTAKLLGCPIAIVSLIDDRRQLLKSAFGVEAETETPIAHSFCAHVVTARLPLIVEDAATHPLVRHNPAVGSLGVRAYAGFPLVVGGEAIGSLCVVDRAPRAWSHEEMATLRDLTSMVADQIALRNSALHMERRADVGEAFMRGENTGVLLTDLDLTIVHSNATFAAFLGYEASALTGRPYASIKAEDDLTDTFLAREELLSGRAAVLDIVVPFVHKSGRAVTLAITVEIIRDARGVPHHILVRSWA